MAAYRPAGPPHQPKVAQLERETRFGGAVRARGQCRQEDVGGLAVAVDEVAGMDVRQGAQELHGDGSALNRGRHAARAYRHVQV